MIAFEVTEGDYGPLVTIRAMQDGEPIYRRIIPRNMVEEIKNFVRVRATPPFFWLGREAEEL